MIKRLGLFLIVAMIVFGCGKKVMVPPRIDLTQHEVIGIIEFTCSNKGKLEPLVTKRFMEAARIDQGMVRIVELGSEDEVLKAVNKDRLDQDAYKAIGEKYDVSTIITGELVVSDVRPDITITPGGGFMDFAAEVDASLAAQMVETSTGASIWSSTASETKTVGHVSIFGGKAFAFDADDPDKAYGKLTDALVEEVTSDFRVTWQRK